MIGTIGMSRFDLHAASNRSSPALGDRAKSNREERLPPFLPHLFRSPPLRILQSRIVNRIARKAPCGSILVPRLDVPNWKRERIYLTTR
jgi:hypothetical protein